MSIQRYFGWRPDTPDFRDHICRIQVPPSLPTFVDLRPQFPAVYDQEQLGSCVANAISGMMESAQIREKLKYEFTPSRLFTYYQIRVLEGTVTSDAGGEIRDGIKAVNLYGSCPESDWPYDVSQFAVKPTPVAYKDAKLHKSLQYASVNVDVPSVQEVMAAGFPVVFGFTVYSSFMSDEVAASGIMPMPTKSESVEGGHAVVMAGYSTVSWTDKGTGRSLPPGLIVRNSWGADWGIGGYFIMPFDYVTTDLSDDYWQIDVVE